MPYKLARSKQGHANQTNIKDANANHRPETTTTKDSNSEHQLRHAQVMYTNLDCHLQEARGARCEAAEAAPVNREHPRTPPIGARQVMCQAVRPGTGSSRAGGARALLRGHPDASASNRRVTQILQNINQY